MGQDFVCAYPEKIGNEEKSTFFLNMNFIKQIKVSLDENDNWKIFFHTGTEQYISYENFENEEQAVDFVCELIGNK